MNQDKQSMKKSMTLFAVLFVVIVAGVLIFRHQVIDNQPAAVPLSQKSPIVNPGGVVNATTSTNLEAKSFGLYVTDGDKQPVSASAFANPSVRGVIFHLRWDWLNPGEGVYDWTQIDGKIANAVANHKTYAVDISPGRFTPAYLYAAGTPSLQFTTSSGNCINNGVPWDSKYIAAYSKVVHDLAQHIKSNPAWYQSLESLSIAPYGDSTSELRLALDVGPAPNQVCGNTASFANPTAAWKSAGYTPTKMFDAWNTLSNVYKTEFPDKEFKISVIPGQAFPGINDEGVVGNRNTVSNQLTQRIIDDCVAKFGSKCVVQWTALNNTNGPIAFLDGAGAQGAIKSYQLEYREYANPSCLVSAAPAPCNQDDLKAVIDRALMIGAQKLEVFSKNVDAYSAALNYGKDKFNEKFGVSSIGTAPNVPLAPPHAGHQQGNPDITSPTASITSPSSNQTVGGIVAITATASDNIAVASVDFYIDNIYASTDSSSPFQLSWNASTVSNSTHTISAKAYDAAGNMGLSAPVSVTVNNTVADIAPPTISITSPLNNQHYGKTGTVTILTNATDNVAVAKVDIYINNQLKCTVTTSPFGCQWSWQLPSWWFSWWHVTFDIKAVATDQAGNTTTSGTVTMNVN